MCVIVRGEVMLAFVICVEFGLFWLLLHVQEFLIPLFRASVFVL